MAPAVTEPVPLLQLGLVCEQAAMAIDCICDTVSEQLTELQLSLAVNTYTPAGRPVNVAVVPIT